MRTFCTSILALMIAGTVAAQPPAERTVTFRAHPLASALDSLGRWYGVPIIYREDDVRGRQVSLRCTGCSFERALQETLAGTSLDAVASGRQVIIRQRQTIAHVEEGTIAGSVRDAVTGDAIMGAIALLRRQDAPADGRPVRTGSSSTFGFFSLRSLQAGAYVLEVRCIGYLPQTVPIDLVNGQEVRKEIALRQKSIALSEMTVEGERMTGATGGGLARGLFVRSIPSDPNEYILDGARIYNPAHFGGVLSTFHPEALNEIEVGRAGLPPSFGGRFGGMLDLALRDGMREQITGSAAADFLGVSASLEGPIGGPASFLITARRNWPDGQVPGRDEEGVPTRLGTQEFIAKVAGRLSPGSRLTAHVYLSTDQYTNTSMAGSPALTNDFTWWNASYNVRWSSILSSSLFAHASLTHTRYGFGLQHMTTPSARAINGSSYAIADVTVRAEVEHYYDVMHIFGGGFEVTRHNVRGRISAFDAVAAPFRIKEEQLWDVALYARDRLALTEDVSAEVGLRVTSFIGADETFSAIDPRLALHMAFSDRTRAYLTFASINRFMHPYRQSGTFLCYPTPFWYPSGGGVPSSTSVQCALGLVADVVSDDVVFGAEAFYRSASRIHDVRWSPLAPGDLTEVLVTGDETSYGIDLSLRKRTGPVSAAASYTYARTERTFASLNNGDPAIPPFTPEHEIHVSIGYVPDEEWLMGVIAVFNPGSWIDPGVYAMSNGVGMPADVTAMRNNQGSAFADVNGSRLPGFERLEFQVERRIGFGGSAGTVSLRLVNGYGLIDPVEWVFAPSGDERFSWQARVRKLGLFPLYPIVGVSFHI